MIHSNFAPFHHVYESSWRGNEQMTATSQVTQLTSYISSTIDHTGTQVGAVGELESKLFQIKFYQKFQQLIPCEHPQATKLSTNWSSKTSGQMSIKKNIMAVAFN